MNTLKNTSALRKHLEPAEGVLHNDVTRSGWKPAANRLPDPGSATWKAPCAHDPAPGSSRWRAPSPNGPAPGSAAWTRTLSPDERARLNMTPIISTIGCAIALIGALYLGGTALTSSQLQSGTWSHYADGITLTLDFDESHIDYSAETYMPFYGPYEISIADFEYRVIAPGVIQAHTGVWSDWRTLSVSIEGDSLRFSPALTSTDASELWVK